MPITTALLEKPPPGIDNGTIAISREEIWDLIQCAEYVDRAIADSNYESEGYNPRADIAEIIRRLIYIGGGKKAFPLDRHPYRYCRGASYRSRMAAKKNDPLWP